MTKRIRTEKRNRRTADAHKSRKRAHAALNMIGLQKTKAELDASQPSEAWPRKVCLGRGLLPRLHRHPISPT
jgi:hypothetical protein